MRETRDEQRATVGDLTERELIARIQQRLQPPPAWVLVGIGDDAAVVEPERQRVEVLTVDALVEGVHFDRAFTPPDAIGHRALAVNLSDLAAMGAAPRLALLSMALPSALPLPDFDGIVDGFARLAAAHRLHVVGGNLTRTPGPMMLDVTVMGTAKRRQVLTRSAAKPNDEIYLSGAIGAAAAGLRMLKLSAAEDRTLLSPESSVVERYLRPEPRVRLGVLLARNRAVSSCVDLSDGLADGLQRIAEASGVGMTVDAGAIPIAPDAARVFDAAGLDPLDAALSSDDYELLVTVPPRARRRFAAAARQAGATMTRIGACTADPAVTLRRPAAGGPVETAVPAGYSHFRAPQGSHSA